MQTDAYRLWLSKIVTFAVAALAAASVAYWGLKGWSASPPAAIPALAADWAHPGGPKAVARALGGGLAAPSAVAAEAPVVSRYTLVGVAARGTEGGAALISIDSQEARPFRVGAQLDGGMVLQSVTGRRAVLSSGVAGSATVTLELPPLEE